MTDPRRSIAWFRGDLRLTDNRMLAEATRSERAWPVFVIDPELIQIHEAARGRRAWFDSSIRTLDQALRAHGSGLTVLHGRPEDVLRDFARSVDAGRVVAAADEDPAAIARDARVAERLSLRLVDDQRIIPPRQLRTGDDKPFSVFGPFRRALEAAIADSDHEAFHRADADLTRLAPPSSTGMGIGTDPPHGLPVAGEAAATDRLRAFLRSGIAAYHDDRDRPDRDATSHLSPYLRVGALSIRACWRAADNAAKRARDIGDATLGRGADRWRGELTWREFFAHVMAAEPRLARESRRREYDDIDWQAGPDADAHLDAWRSGTTGYPFVDAGMRQLVATGWMHNRARLVTASFLVKDLGLDWRRGEAVFSEHLLDADVPQNNGNWQWVAGVGTDAAPYFRVFNPTLQGRKFDPDAAYARAWIPELADLPDDAVYEPWRATGMPRDYPAPIVDHAEARERTLARYRAISG